MTGCDETITSDEKASYRKEVPDISGLLFGRLTAISRHPRSGNYWKCVCECGTTVVAQVKLLKLGKTKSCGCLRIHNNKSRSLNLLGQTFGRLTVVKKSERGGRYWDCVCICGETLTTLSGSLKTGATSSCGCLRSEVAATNLIRHIEDYRESLGFCPTTPMCSDRKLQRAASTVQARGIYSRDNYACVWCSATGIPLNAHHIETWAACPEKRFDETNLVTLCRPCHLIVHNGDYATIPDAYMSILLQGYTKVVDDYGMTPRLEVSAT